MPCATTLIVRCPSRVLRRAWSCYRHDAHTIAHTFLNCGRTQRYVSQENQHVAIASVPRCTRVPDSSPVRSAISSGTHVSGPGVDRKLGGVAHGGPRRSRHGCQRRSRVRAPWPACNGCLGVAAVAARTGPWPYPSTSKSSRSRVVSSLAMVSAVMALGCSISGATSLATWASIPGAPPACTGRCRGTPARRNDRLDRRCAGARCGRLVPQVPRWGRRREPRRGPPW